MGAAWLFPGWAALLEPTLQALKELGTSEDPGREMLLVHNLMHFDDISVHCQQSMKVIMEELKHHPAGRIFIVVELGSEIYNLLEGKRKGLGMQL